MWREGETRHSSRNPCGYITSLKWPSKGWGDVFTFFPFPPPQSETQPALWFVSCQASSGLFPAFGLRGPQGLVLALGHCRGALGSHPQPGSLLVAIASSIFKLLFLNFRKGPSFTSHLGVESRSPRLSIGAPESGKCWEGGRTLAGGNENQQACVKGALCVLQTQSRLSSGGVGGEILCPCPS